MSKLLSLIPDTIPESQKISKTDFVRDRKLPFKNVITFVLSSVASGGNRGIDCKIGEFFSTAQKSALVAKTETVHRSAISNARKKISWEVFNDIFKRTVKLALTTLPDLPEYLWKGHSVYAIDGSKYTLPATKDIREELDPNSGSKKTTRGHYPQCLVSTVYDVFRKISIARTVTGYHGSERDEAKKMIDNIPPNGVVVFDRGYPGYDMFDQMNKRYNGYWLFRCKIGTTFNAVKKFLNTDKLEDTIIIEPPIKFLSNNKERAGEYSSLHIRVIRVVSPDGTSSVLLTNLPTRKKYSYQEIIDLYYKRYKVEEQYREEKKTLEVEKFHSRSVNGILQEIYAAAIMTIIPRLLTEIENTKAPQLHSVPKFKNAVNTFSRHAWLLIATDPLKAAVLFNEILDEIARVRYYPPKRTRPNQPRICKKARSKWANSWFSS